MTEIVRPARRLLRMGMALALLLCLGAYLAGKMSFYLPAFSTTIDPSELRGTWVQAKSITSRKKIDVMLRRAEAGHFNAIFVDVFEAGQTFYDSTLASKHPQIEPGFDPLVYLVPAAHRRNIAVHAWFITGSVGDKEGSPLLDEHPDWALVGPDGKSIDWLNFARPDVRQFIGDLMLEVVERYGVDGVHFDYARYPGPEWGFDPYSVEMFTKEYQLDLNQLRYADLPAYGVFEGNPLTDPGSAQILATFADGQPAVLLNSYGQGEVVLLNWNASSRSTAAGGEILQRSLLRLLDAGGDVYLLRSETNAKQYGYDDFIQGKAWLDHLGWAPRELKEADVPNLTAESVLVLPNVHLISQPVAAQLADFVRGGGGLIFIDGPTKSIKLEEIQAITGMRSRGRYFKRVTLMTATGEHPLIPLSRRSADLAMYQRRDAQWQAFRRQSIDNLLRDVYRRIKSTHPHVAVSVTITSNQEKAVMDVFQDWRAWLEGGYVDFLVPRGYVEQVQILEPMLIDWQPVMRDYDRITIGVKAFTGDGKSAIQKSSSQLLVELEMAHTAGSNGIIIFDLDRISDKQLRALAAGPFALSTTSTGE